ncbi:MAG: carbamoyltransferase C-terminal domain-containing protein [Verrucomicrobiales bacterium]
MDAAFGDRYRGRYAFADHHEAHAASAFFPSPFEEAAVLTIDGVGEWATSSIGHGQGNRLRMLRETRFPHSLGLLYSAFTYYTGFRVNSGEYKVMGAAPYGEPRFKELILEHLIQVSEDRSFWMDMAYFNYCQGTTMTSEKFHALFGGPPRRPETPIAQREMDLAASVQAVCEEVVLRCGRHAHALTGSPNLVMAGGVALNCVANGRLRREGPFENVWIQPAAGDAGGALGAALIAHHHIFGFRRDTRCPDAMRGSLLGPAVRNDDVAALLRSEGAAFHHLPDEAALFDRVADLLASEKVVGWVQGRMEFGPRALGGRSILGDPRSEKMQRVMNLKIKFRESFRPFAPSVLAGRMEEFFDLPAGSDSPYMLLVAPVNEAKRTPGATEAMRGLEGLDRLGIKRSEIPAITHVDFSARVQTVDPDRNPRYHGLLQRFHAKTGCPILVNTSFNIRGEPIVCTPADAYRCFLGTDMDALVLGDYVLLKDEQPNLEKIDRDAYQSAFALD